MWKSEIMKQKWKGKNEVYTIGVLMAHKVHNITLCIINLVAHVEHKLVIQSAIITA
jgi:hypothetical protein